MKAFLGLFLLVLAVSVRSASDDAQYRDDCPDWASTDQCDENPGFMCDNCAGSCEKECEGGRRTDDESTSAPAPSPEDDDDDRTPVGDDCESKIDDLADRMRDIEDILEDIYDLVSTGPGGGGVPAGGGPDRSSGTPKGDCADYEGIPNGVNTLCCAAYCDDCEQIGCADRGNVLDCCPLNLDIERICDRGDDAPCIL